MLTDSSTSGVVTKRLVKRVRPFFCTFVRVSVRGNLLLALLLSQFIAQQGQILGQSRASHGLQSMGKVVASHEIPWSEVELYNNWKTATIIDKISFGQTNGPMEAPICL